MKKPILSIFRAYYSHLDYNTTYGDNGDWDGTGYYIHTSGLAVSIRQYCWCGKLCCKLYLNHKGIGYEKTYNDTFFYERGLRLICAAFIKEFNKSILTIKTMTKRELINALEACLLPDDAKVCIYDWKKSRDEDDGESPSGAVYDFEVNTLNDGLSESDIQEIRDEHDIDPLPFIALSFDNPERDD